MEHYDSPLQILDYFSLTVIELAAFLFVSVSNVNTEGVSDFIPYNCRKWNLYLRLWKL